MIASLNSSLLPGSIALSSAPASSSSSTTGGTRCIFDPEVIKKYSGYDAEYIWKNYNKHYSEYYYQIIRTRKMTVIAVNDDTDLLISFVEDYTDYDRGCVLHELFEYDAVNCVTALLDDDGEATGLIELPPPIELMDLASDYGAQRCIKLFLDHFGVDVANLRDSDNLLPLNHAIFALTEPNNPWNDPTVPIPSTLYQFCDWENRHKLETIRILAHHTKQLQQEFIKYAMEGSSDEVAILLLVAREKVMPLCAELRKALIEEKTLLHFHDVTSALSSATHLFTRKRMYLQLTLTWLDVLEKVGHEFFDYFCLPKDDWDWKDIKHILEGAGYSVKYMNEFAVFARAFGGLQKIIPKSCSKAYDR